MLTEGPYYHTEGHPIRQNMAEDQLGFPFVRHFDLLLRAKEREIEIVPCH